jgi:8-oxo-dGTP pyrophosphatase MutT (NUDIX family)
VTAVRDRAWLKSRFADRTTIPPASPAVPDYRVERGDHTLNLDMHPDPPMKAAAVLVPCVDHTDGLTILMTRRTAHLANHAGQISFPGGHIEPGDGGPVATALRETEEEVGIRGQDVEIVGHLDTYVTRTGFIVTPVVGLLSPPLSIRPDPHEVDEVFEVPLDHFLDPANHKHCSATFEGAVRHFYAMPFGPYFIWGATAGMLMNLYEILSAS